MIDSTIITDPYIYVTDDVLSEDKCNQILKKFNTKNKQHSQGEIGSGIDTTIKNSKDVHISTAPGWKREDKLFHDIIAKGHAEYWNHLNDPTVNNFYLFTDPTRTKRFEFHPRYAENLDLIDTGYQIQKTEPGKGYVWHDDFDSFAKNDSFGVRYLTYILYLNTVEEGWTQFYNGNRVSPKAGRLVFFPAIWTYLHQGYPPKQTKYIMTGWMHTNQKPPIQNGKN